MVIFPRWRYADAECGAARGKRRDDALERLYKTTIFVSF